MHGSNESLLSTLFEIDDGYEWTEIDSDVLAQLLELGASMDAVQRQGRHVSLETIVNEKLARSPAKRQVLETLSFHRAARAQAQAEAEAAAAAAAAAEAEAAGEAEGEAEAQEGYSEQDASFVADSHEFVAEGADDAEEEGVPAPESNPPLQASTSESLKEKHTTPPPRVRQASVHSGADTASTASGDRGPMPKVKARVTKPSAKAAAHVEAPGSVASGSAKVHETEDSWENFENDS